MTFILIFKIFSKWKKTIIYKRSTWPKKKQQMKCDPSAGQISTYFPCSLASSKSCRKASFFSRSFRCFSRLSSSALSLTYCSNTCFLSLEVRSRYLWSNTILWSSFSQVENADTYNQNPNRVSPQLSITSIKQSVWICLYLNFAWINNLNKISIIK